MSLTFHISGGDELDRQLKAAAGEVETAVKRAILDTVLQAEVAIAAKIDEMHAVDTGALKGSIRHGAQGSATEISSGGLSAVVGTNVGYAIPVHEGYIRKLKKVGKKPKGSSAAARRRKARFEAQEKAGAKRTKGIKNVLLQQAFVSARDTETGETFTALAVRGRPYMREALPEIEEAFKAAIDEHLRNA